MKRDAPIPLYAQIAAALRDDLAGPGFGPDGRLPSEEELRERFGVSRVTVRLALAELEREGLILRRKGKGTYASGKPVRHALDTLRSFHESLRLQGFRAGIRLISAALDPEAGDDPLPLHVARLHLADGKPIAVGVSRLPGVLAGFDWAAAPDQPIYAILAAELGLAPVTAEFALGLGSAEAEVADRLEVAAGRPLLRLERTSFDAEGRAVDRSTFLIRPERYQFTLKSRY